MAGNSTPSLTTTVTSPEAALKALVDDVESTTELWAVEGVVVADGERTKKGFPAPDVATLMGVEGVMEESSTSPSAGDAAVGVAGSWRLRF